VKTVFEGKRPFFQGNF